MAGLFSKMSAWTRAKGKRIFGKSIFLRSVGVTGKSDELKVGDLSLDRARHEVRAANTIIECTPKEFILLGLLMERSGKVQTREQPLNDVWEMDLEVSPRAVDRHVCCLRAKLGELGRYIETIPSTGYRLLAQDQIAA
jgi:DNA-binding response OmpR family regulator